MADKPMVMTVGTYSSLADAESDFYNVMALHKEGDLGHVAATILTKTPDGKLTMDRHDTTAKHLAWGGAIVGGLMGVLYPPLGAVLLMSSVPGAMVAAGTVDAAVVAGAGGVVGHYWHNIPKRDLREMSDVLESNQVALVVVAIQKQPIEIDSAIAMASSKVIKYVEHGDVEAAYRQSVEDFKAAA